MNFIYNKQVKGKYKDLIKPFKVSFILLFSILPFMTFIYFMTSNYPLGTLDQIPLSTFIKEF
jgi:hypothetical protein